MTGDEQIKRALDRAQYMAQVAKTQAMKSTLTEAAAALESLSGELTATQNVVAQYAEGEAKLREEVESLRTTIATLNESLRITSEGNFKLREQLAVAEKERLAGPAAPLYRRASLSMEVAMGKMSEVETPTAVKPHRCEWCWKTIPAGEQYRRYRYWADGDAGTVKLHAECFEEMQDAAADEGGCIEWTPGSGERPNV